MPSLVCFYGLDLLWAFIQDDPKSSVPVQVVELAIDHIIALLGFVDGKEPEWALQPSLLHNAGAWDSSGRSRLPPPESAQQAASVMLKHQLVSRCVENLEANSSSPQSLHMMQVRRVRVTVCHHCGVCAVVPCWLRRAVVTVRACVYVCVHAASAEHAPTEPAIVVFARQELRWRGAGVAAEQADQGPATARHLLQQPAGPLLRVVCVERCPSAALARVLVRSTTTSW